jgi:Ran GTPase-activating protein (RanGAP) involved in mRNA processing and transport
MEEQQQQQQQHRTIHNVILNGIARLSDPQYREERHKLKIIGDFPRPRIDRHSWQHLVDFLDDRRGSHDEVAITELELGCIQLSEPFDGGLNVLRAFFARSDTTLTKVTLDCWLPQDASRLLLEAFHTNRTITDLTIRRIINLEGAALGYSLSSLMQNMPQLQRLDCGVLAFQPTLQTNRTLRELSLWGCQIGDHGIRILADGLVGNTTIEILNLGANRITSVGLDDITRLLESESTRIKKINLEYNRGIFNDEASTLRFARVLSRHQFLKELNLGTCEIGNDGIRILVDGLVGNAIMEDLNIQHNGITVVGLAEITRLIVSARLRVIHFCGNRGIFNDTDATQDFVSTLQHKESSVQELDSFWISPQNIRAGIDNCLKRNEQLNRANLLLAPPPPDRTALMMLKTWHKAIAKFATVPNNAGASAILKLFTKRPQILEKRIQQPLAVAAAPVVAVAAPVVAAAAPVIAAVAPHDTGNNSSRKRRRRS